jgi:hypothetical protein
MYPNAILKADLERKQSELASSVIYVRPKQKECRLRWHSSLTHGMMANRPQRRARIIMCDVAFTQWPNEGAGIVIPILSQHEDDECEGDGDACQQVAVMAGSNADLVPIPCPLIWSLTNERQMHVRVDLTPLWLMWRRTLLSKHPIQCIHLTFYNKQVLGSQTTITLPLVWTDPPKRKARSNPMVHAEMVPATTSSNNMEWSSTTTSSQSMLSLVVP